MLSTLVAVAPCVSIFVRMTVELELYIADRGVLPAEKCSLEV